MWRPRDPRWRQNARSSETPDCSSLVSAVIPDRSSLASVVIPDRSSVTSVVVAAIAVAAVVGGLVAASAGVAAHQFVSFDRAPLTGTAGEPVEVPINLHRTDRVTVTADGPAGGFTAVVVDDGDERATLVVDPSGDNGSSVAVGAESGSAELTDADGPLGPGEYELSLSVRRGLGDTTTLTLTPAADRRLSLPTLVGGLVAPLVPVALLAVVARATGESRPESE